MRITPVLLLVPLLATTPAAPARTRAAPPMGELVLDLGDPAVTATIAGIRLRLVVSLDTRDVIELDPRAAARLPLTWAAGGEIEVGRVLLPGRQARAEAEIGGRRVTLVVATHDRAWCAGADGEIGPELLPYARVRFVRRGGAGLAAAPAALEPRRLRALVSPRAGLVAIEGRGANAIAIKFAPGHDETVATASAAAIVAARAGAAWAGPARPLPLALGVVRPVRPLRLAAPATIAGFKIATLLVRIADFRGGRELPGDPPAGADLVVTARNRPSQHDWPAVSLGRDVLDPCAEIAVVRVPALAVEVRCAAPESPR